MNCRQLERYLRAHGCLLYHHDGKQDVWFNHSNLAQVSVPRHNRINRGTVRGTCRIQGASRPPEI
jgi:hypothetical protein